MKLTKNEVELLADSLNGTYLDDDHIKAMCRDNGCYAMDGTLFSSSLEMGISDSITLNNMAERYDIDPVAFLTKIRSMSPAQREHVVQAIKRAWDGHMDRELDGLTKIEWDSRSPVRNN